MFRLAHQLTAKDQLKIAHFSQLYAGYGHVTNRTHKKIGVYNTLRSGQSHGLNWNDVFQCGWARGCGRQLPNPCPIVITTNQTA
jgi:hypothetical protein